MKIHPLQEKPFVLFLHTNPSMNPTVLCNLFISSQGVRNFHTEDYLKIFSIFHRQFKYSLLLVQCYSTTSIISKSFSLCDTWNYPIEAWHKDFVVLVSLRKDPQCSVHNKFFTRQYLMPVEALESVMCEVMKVRLKMRDATRSK